jgi:hypothetical protein
MDSYTDEQKVISRWSLSTVVLDLLASIVPEDGHFERWTSNIVKEQCIVFYNANESSANLILHQHVQLCCWQVLYIWSKS